MNFDWYEKIKSWYPKYWSERMVLEAVKKGKITQEQANDIIGGDK